MTIIMCGLRLSSMKLPTLRSRSFMNIQELVSVKCRRLQFGGTKEMAGLQSFATCSIPHLVAFHCRTLKNKPHMSGF